jgi:hypothetical protein
MNKLLLTTIISILLAGTSLAKDQRDCSLITGDDPYADQDRAFCYIEQNEKFFKSIKDGFFPWQRGLPLIGNCGYMADKRGENVGYGSCKEDSEKGCIIVMVKTKRLVKKYFKKFKDKKIGDFILLFEKAEKQCLE